MELWIEYQTAERLPAAYEQRIVRVAEESLRLEQADPHVEISLLLVDNERIRSLNRRYRKIDKETDVLSFPQEDKPGQSSGQLSEPLSGRLSGAGPRPLGDIVISLEQAKTQAEEYGHSLERELGFLTAHSMLHLLGYDHQTREDETVMCQKQEKILSRAGLAR
ncbi:MAG: rRNA maturation RNase YbeY [Clostridiales bacterium]|nr:rRNA maturation RNase YbeY [Clostridiales bacterium]